MEASVARRLFEVARPYRGSFLVGVLATITASLLDGLTIVVLIPLLKALFGTAGAFENSNTPLEAVTDRLLAPIIGGLAPGAAGGRLVLLLMGIFVAKNLIGYSAAQLLVRVQEGVVRDLRVKLYRHLMSIDLSFFQRTRQGDLVAGVISDADQTKQAVSAFWGAFFQNLVLIATSLWVLALISWRLTLLTLAAAPILVAGIQQLLIRLRRHSREMTEERGQLTATVSERLASIKLIRGYGAERQEIETFANQTDRYRKRVVRTQRFASMTHPVTELFGVAVIVVTIWIAGNPAVSGASLGPAVTIGFLAVALKMMAPIKAIAQFPTNVALALASAERVFRWLDLEPKDRDPAGLPQARFERSLRFDRVSFTYGDEPVLEDVSFEVEKGSIVAVVGPSGAGKTTLLELVPRFYEPTSGSIELDRVPIRAVSRASLRALIGLVGQETVVLNDTVHANIAYGRPNATREQVIEAARAANALEFIERLPAGFETLLGERGTRLSGGQRQRVAIARALLRDPPLLILDEATSALDTESERLVQGAIDRLMEERTVLVVAHRLATVQHADEILVLDGGRIVERGDHSTLLAMNGLYRRLYDFQFRTPEEVA
jgi:subfamily B ATP-binding cassette protein MsbA